MGTSYEADLAAWAIEQAALLRSGKLSAIDAVNIAEEIEDVARSEKRELKSHMSALLSHLLRWKFQPGDRSKSWSSTIRSQRGEVRQILDESPSLILAFDDENWLRLTWHGAAAAAQADIDCDFPDMWIWTLDQVLGDDFWPD